MTINEAIRTFRLPNPTTPENLKCRWIKTLQFGDKILMAGYYYNGMNKPCYSRATYEFLTDDTSCEGTIGLHSVSDVEFEDDGHAIAWAMSHAEQENPEYEYSKRLSRITDEILRLREQKEQSEVDNHHWEETINRIKELQDFIAKQKTDITGFDEVLVNKLIEKITVFTDHFTVEFKSGLTIEIEA